MIMVSKISVCLFVCFVLNDFSEGTLHYSFRNKKSTPQSRFELRVGTVMNFWKIKILKIFKKWENPCVFPNRLFSILFYKTRKITLSKNSWGYVKNQWTNTRLVCTHLHPFCLLNSYEDRNKLIHYVCKKVKIVQMIDIYLKRVIG